MSKKVKGSTKKEGVLLKSVEKSSKYEPIEIVLASSPPTRRNAAATIERTDRYKNIRDYGVVPFKSSSSSDYGSSMDVREAVILCQKAYYNFPIFKNTIDLMTEFSSSSIFFKDGSKKSRDFFKGLFSKINITGLQDRFFREYYRSGNVFILKMEGDVQTEDIPKINQTFGSNISQAKTVSLPVRYVILNPSDIKSGGSISFADTIYYKSLTDYELAKLRSPKTNEDREILEKLPTEVIKKIKSGRNSEVLLPLDNDDITAVFYKKQDYEPFAVPMGYPVLSDINWKEEMKKMDMALTRTMNQIILLITMGNEPDKGGVNQANIVAMQQFFQNESVARVLIADYTTKAEWKIPDIANILDPKKYAVVDRDIKEGLNNLLVNSDDKFANASVKIEVFVERLRQARESFLTEFLQPEIKKIAQDIGLKNYPTAYFEEINIKDNLEYAKVYTRLAELGVLTPSEALESIDNGRLPSIEESLENQALLRGYKDKGYYEPIVGGPYSQSKLQEENLKNQAQNNKIQQPEVKVSTPAGRPSGTKTSKKPGLVGYSLSKLKDNLLASSKLQNEIESIFLEKSKSKKLPEAKSQAAKILSEKIVANENPENWISSISSYLEDPLKENKDRLAEIEKIAIEHQLSEFLAGLLYHSKINAPE